MRTAVFAVSALLFFAGRAHATLTPVADFGDNPGALSMYEYVPDGLPSGRPVVVVMHGCTQPASGMEAAGWNELADLYEFAVVYPQQSADNNPLTCFNWAGEYGDEANMVRGQGENQSIVSMVDHMVATYGSDAGRVYVAGFSAGGAFAAVLLATWPDRFRAGAIMSGVPYRCATTVNGAYSCQQMPAAGMKTAAQWGDLVRGAAPSGFAGPWPRVQLWQGESDGTVYPANQGELVEQWTDVHGVDQVAEVTDVVGEIGHATHEVGGEVVVEVFTVPGMGHAVAIGPDDAEHPCGPLGAAYFANEHVCSTWRAAQFFGLTGGGGGGGGGGDDDGGGGGDDDGGGGGDDDGGGGGGDDDGGNGADGGGLPGCGGLDAGGGARSFVMLVIVALAIGGLVPRRRRIARG